jgi:predicted SprT family Zn-dependent metalloprotease
MEGKRCHEIAINPAHLGQSRVIDVLQTLVHEMVHCWQHCFGSPGRGNYHNKEWAHKMIHIGLQPTSTGLPGGDIIGQMMSDYPIEGGPFLKACETLITHGSFTIPWIDRRSTPKSLLHENSALTAADIIRGYPLSEAPDPEDLPAPEEDRSIAQLLQMAYAEIMPEDTFLPVQHRIRVKNKYQCPQCRNRVWGKPEMNIICGDCQVQFEPI